MNAQTQSGARAVVYSRVSSDAQERDGTSLEGQEDAGLAYCREHDYTVIATVRDTESSKTLGRPGIERLRTMLRAGEVDVVVAHAVDRLARHQNHMGVLFDEIERGGARLELVTEAFEDTAVGRFIVAARAFVAEVEREKIGTRTRTGRRLRALEGRYMAARVPYGYRRMGEGHLAIDEPQARIVQDMFARFAEGESFRSIAITLNELGVPTSRGKPWERQVIAKMLTNDAYIGTMRYLDVVIPHALPAIVSEDLYAMVQRQIASRPPRGGGRGARSVHLLSGVLYCGECGGRMYGRRWTDSDKPRVYDCGTYNKGGGCAPNVHDGEELERAVVAIINDEAKGYRLVRDLQRNAVTRMHDDLELAQRELTRLDRERENLVSAIRKGILPDDDAADAAREIAEERSKAIALVAQLRAKVEAAEADEDRAERMPREARKLLDETLSSVERKRILATVLAGSRVIVGRDGNVRIE